MRKQELVQLHALCSQVREYVERRYDVPPGAFERYERSEVSSVAIYRRKEAHEEALSRLLVDLAEVLAAHVDDPSGQSPTVTTSWQADEAARRPDEAARRADEVGDEPREGIADRGDRW
jgi:hypothetical protein